jgi:hypothetical protein
MKAAFRIAMAIFATALFAPALIAQGRALVLLPTQDVTIYESATGDISNGAGESGFVGVDTNGAARRYLIKFDVAGAIPPGASITGASLDLRFTAVAPGAGVETFDVHRMLTSWSEGASIGGEQGAPATFGDATWVHSSYPGVNWSTPGGDFDPIPSVTSTIDAFYYPIFRSVQLRADARDFHNNPATNFGWILKATFESGASGRTLASRENQDTSLRPVLRLGYTFPSIATFCDHAYANSTGRAAVITGHVGTGVGSGLHLDVSGGPLLPNGQRMLGYFLVGDSPQFGIPVSDGLLCLAGSGGVFTRYNIAGSRSSIGLFDAAGNLENMVGTGGPTGYGFDVPSELDLWGYGPTITAGDTLHFQCWYRDTASGSGHSNFSTGLSVTL